MRGAGTGPVATLHPVYRPGLDVALAADLLEGSAGARVVVEIRVSGGQPPFSIALYADGEPVGLGSGDDVEYDEQAGWLRSTLHGLRSGVEPLALTARAVDARGRWGGASVVLVGSPVGAG